MSERLFVRVFVGIALGLAVFASCFCQFQAGQMESQNYLRSPCSNPSSTAWRYRWLPSMGDYCFLLPPLRGLVRGRLPIEISGRGARFADSADEAFDNLEETVANLTKKLSLVAEDVESLKCAIDDKTERPIVSEP